MNTTPKITDGAREAAVQTISAWIRTTNKHTDIHDDDYKTLLNMVALCVRQNCDSVCAEKDAEIERLKAELNELTNPCMGDEPCDECGVNTLELLKERDTLKSQLAELTSIAKEFETVVKDHQYGSDDECEGCGHTQECARNCDINNVLLNFTAYLRK